MAKPKDITGQKFGRLIAIKSIGKTKYGSYIWLCKCDCGNEKEVCLSSLTSGYTKSCGCLHDEGNRKTHGLKHTRLYRVWRNMKNRCNNKNNKAYKFYGARNIKICEEWNNDFKAFHDWAFSNGYDENAEFMKCTIDRINSNGNYEPSNCRWVTIKEQQKNKRSNILITYQGETHCIAEWAEIYNLKYKCLNKRISRGWNIEKALITPSKVNNN